MSRPKQIYVVCGPGGAGKGTIVQQMLEDDPGLALSRSWTTRTQRKSEPDDAYTFVTREQFDEKIAQDGFLEWAQFLEHRYGTPHPSPDLDSDLILEIEVQGAALVREKAADAVVIMVLPPSRLEQERRMRERGDSDEIVAHRLAKSDAELAAGYVMADLVVVNNDVKVAADEICKLVQRTRTERSQAPLPSTVRKSNA